MSRFGNLEFEPAQATEGVRMERDEAFWLGEANTAFNRADFEPALRLFARVLEHNPQNITAWTGQIRSLIELGEFREAKLWSDKALERFPNAPELLAAKAVALGRLGDIDNALAFSDASLEERGDTPYVWLARGDVLLARKEPRADHCFERARSIAPADWIIAWLAARIRQFYRQFAAALKLAQEAVALAPGECVLWLLTGQCQAALGLPDRARVSFEQAMQLQPDSRAARQGLDQLNQQGLLARFSGKLRLLFRA
jgi:tetratricopeptide (TPR) repeat protein